jgi:hypothetical protein
MNSSNEVGQVGRVKELIRIDNRTPIFSDKMWKYIRTLIIYWTGFVVSPFLELRERKG